MPLPPTGELFKRGTIGAIDYEVNQVGNGWLMRVRNRATGYNEWTGRAQFDRVYDDGHTPTYRCELEVRAVVGHDADLTLRSRMEQDMAVLELIGPTGDVQGRSFQFMPRPPADDSDLAASQS